MGDIGRPVRKVDIEPIPTTEPVKEPSPAVEPETAPAEPEKVPA